MPVGPAALHQPKIFSQRLESFDVLARVARVSDFQPVEARRNQRLQAFPSASLTGMRPDRQTTGLVGDGNRVLDRQSSLRYERGAGVSQISHERIPKIVNDAARNEGARYVRPADRAAIRLLKNFVQREPDAKGIQLFDDARRSRVP